MCCAAHALFNLTAVEGQENLVGTVFETQEDLDHYFPSIMKYLNNLSEEDIISNNKELNTMFELLEQTCPCLRSLVMPMSLWTHLIDPLLLHLVLMPCISINFLGFYSSFNHSFAQMTIDSIFNEEVEAKTAPKEKGKKHTMPNVR